MEQEVKFVYTLDHSDVTNKAKDIKQVLGEIREVANTMHGSMSKVLDRQTQEARTQNPRDRDAR